MPTPSRPDAPAAVAAGLVVHGLVPAAGRGERFGGGVPKQFLEIGGRPLVAWTVEALLAAGCASLVVALPEEEVALAPARIGADPRIRYVAGGATRQASVACALAASPATGADLVAVHDGARAALAAQDFAATVAAASARGGAILGRMVTDTVKEVADGRVVRTVDRARLFRAETPQVFRRADLERALEAARLNRFVGTDEAALVERLGGIEIAAVEALRPNPKVTWAEDLEALERALRERGAS
jgi:2-C-methyl-D-erythritol 4-phosphate cytidylyltransferase